MNAQHIPTHLIVPSPLNSRTDFDADSLSELSDSIAAHGILQPLTVRPIGDYFEIVCGERRYRAAKLLDLPQLPALVRELDDETTMELMLIENSQREDVTPLEEADAMQKLATAFGRTVESISDKLGVSVSLVRRRLQLAILAPHFRGLLKVERIGLGAAEFVAGLPTALQSELAQHFPEEAVDYYGKPKVWGRSNIVHHAKKLLRQLDRAPWSLTETMPGCLQACADCRKRSSAQPTLFSDFADETDRCLDAECWSQKQTSWVELKRAQGLVVLEGERANEAANPLRCKAVQPLTHGVRHDGRWLRFAELAPATLPRIVALADSGPVECIRVSDLLRSLEEEGRLELVDRITGKAQKRARDAARAQKAAETQARHHAMASVVHAAQSEDFAHWSMILIEAACNEINQDRLIEIARRRQLTFSKDKYGTNYRAGMFEYAQSLQPEEVFGLFVELMLTHAATSWQSQSLEYWLAALRRGETTDSLEGAAE